jgi:hypothetical protein
MAMVTSSTDSLPQSDYALKFLRLFLTEGIATVIFGVVIWFLLPDCENSLQALVTTHDVYIGADSRNAT